MFSQNKEINKIVFVK